MSVDRSETPRRPLHILHAESLITNLAVGALSALQSIVVIRLLSIEDFGRLGIIAALGVTFGITQHLGLSSAMLREVSARSDPNELPNYLWASLGLRLIVTLPLAVTVFALASLIAGSWYDQPAISDSLRVFAVILVVQGLWEIVNYTIQALQAFRPLFAIKIAYAALSLVLTALGAWFAGVWGYYIGTLGAIALSFIGSIWILRGVAPVPLAIPSLSRFRQTAKALLSVSLFVYVAKIAQTLLSQLPILILGATLSIAAVGELKFALTFGGRLLLISASVNTVNLVVLSRLWATAPLEFPAVFRKQFDRYVLVAGLCSSLVVLLAPELTLLIGGSKYSSAASLSALAVFVTFLMSQSHIFTSGAQVVMGDYLGHLLFFALPTVALAGALWFFPASSTFSVLVWLAVAASAGFLQGLVRLARQTGMWLYSARSLLFTAIVGVALVVSFLDASLALRLVAIGTIAAVLVGLGLAWSLVPVPWRARRRTVQLER